MNPSRMLPGTRALRTFEAAGRLLNFTRAADEVGLTPAAVSYQIKEIEDQLGLVLFTRNSRSIQLTPAGAVLLEATADALDGLRRAVGRAQRMARGAGHLRLSLEARFATHWLLPRLARFRAAHPGLELTFDISDQVRDFEIDDIDAAIRFGAGRYPGARADRLFATTLAPIASPALLASGPAIVSPRDLARFPLSHVDCVADGMVWPDWKMWLAAAGVADVDASRSLAFPDSSHVAQAALDGSAVGLLEPAMVAADLASGRLVRLFDIDVGMAPDFAYYLVYPQGSADDARVMALREWLARESCARAAPPLP